MWEGVRRFPPCQGAGSNASSRTDERKQLPKQDPYGYAAPLAGRSARRYASPSALRQASTVGEQLEEARGAVAVTLEMPALRKR